MYDWVLSWAERPQGTWALFVLAIAESSFFPIPPDVLLMALAFGSRKRSFLFAAVATVGTVIGGVLGYSIGVLAFDSIGQGILDLYGLGDGYETVKTLYSENAFEAVFIAGFTPIPYKVFTIAAGVFRVSLALFIGASLLSRAGRFFAVATVIYIFGEPVKKLIDRYFNLATILFGVLLVGGFVVVKLFLH